MKNLVFILVVFLVSIYPAMAQNDRTFYKACRSKNDAVEDLQRSEITVKTLTNDSTIFESNGKAYSTKKVPDYNLMEGHLDELDFYTFKLDENSFLVYWYSYFGENVMNQGWTYYHTDKSKATEKDDNKRCALTEIEKFYADITDYRPKKAEMDKKKFDSETKGVITDFIKNFKSQAKDPLLEKGIQLWWKGGDPNAVVTNPILNIYYSQSGYEYIRNDLGIVLRKSKDVVILFKKKSENKCYIKWLSFGFESLGGGAFSDEMTVWNKAGNRFILPGYRNIYAGILYEVDCAPFESLTPKIK